jgi:ABC-2 type transport system ATP-binding protein
MTGGSAQGAGEPAARGARVQARDLSRRFGDHLALDRLSLEIEPGEAFGLLGANGAGKTTFIRLVTGFLLPSSGEVHVDGHSSAAEPARVRERLGFVAETSRLYPDLHVRGFLRFAGGARGLAGRGLAAAVEEALDRFQLRDVERRLIGHLSKGFQQRLSLAQAFLHQPTLVVVDEPTSGLDPLQQEEVRSVLRGLRGASTLLLCTHDLKEARELTHRVAVLRRGRLVAVGPTEEVLGGEDPLALFGEAVAVGAAS